jgi:phosphate transport system permease protein
MSVLRRWLAEGTAQRWLAGACVLIALTMIVGLVAVVVDVAGAFFWPRPLLEVTLTDGSKALGEVWDREPDPASPGSTRIRLKVGNRDLSGADFRWIRQGDIVRETVPADSWLLERQENGNFYGFPRRLEG